MAYTELDLRERRAIEDMLDAKVPIARIAVEIGRHRSTVYREIKRNYSTDDELPELNGYYCMTAHRKALTRRARRRKLIRLEDLRAHVIDRLADGWTPEQIAGRLGYDGQPSASATRRSTPMSTARKDSRKNWRAFFPADARNGDHAMRDGPEARFFHRIGPSMNARSM